METGAITGYIDVAQIVLYLFWGFFAALILYLRREDKREGYPLESDRANVTVQGFPGIPEPKVYELAHGGTFEAPNDRVDRRPVAAEPSAPWPGAPLEPTGDPMEDGVGPASWAARSDEPELTHEGQPRIVPMRVAPEYWIEERDPDPRGMPVIGTDGQQGGVVRELWIDRAEPQVRYLEVEAAGGGGRRVLLPITLARVVASEGCVKAKSVTGDHFGRAPTIASDERITQLEEDRVCAWFGGGHLYATPDRREPLL